jgi:hypothetical protein
MPSAGFHPGISAINKLHTYISHLMANGIGLNTSYGHENKIYTVQSDKAPPHYKQTTTYEPPPLIYCGVSVQLQSAVPYNSNCKYI